MAPLDTIIHGDARKVLAKLTSSSIQKIVTSPPYYGQRDYCHEEQIGQENSLDLYIESLMEVFNEAWRVLRDDGTMWLNLGDKYEKGEQLGVPWKVCFALKDSGWCLRSDIIWHKSNAMPTPNRNRPSPDHEYIFLLTKQKSGYFYNGDDIREPHVTFTAESKMRGGRNHIGKRDGTPENGKNGGVSNLHSGHWDKAFHPLGRNKRTVWKVPLSKNRAAHFAVFPEKLIEPCILAGSPPGGVVLDPFFGSGTTGVVAKQLGRHFLGIEVNEEFIKIATDRINGTSLRFVQQAI